MTEYRLAGVATKANCKALEQHINKRMSPGDPFTITISESNLLTVKLAQKVLGEAGIETVIEMRQAEWRSYEP